MYIYIYICIYITSISISLSPSLSLYVYIYIYCIIVIGQERQDLHRRRRLREDGLRRGVREGARVAGVGQSSN